MSHSGNWLERAIERFLFASRWVMAPFYAGMVLALLFLLMVFFRELAAEFIHWHAATAENAILLSLSLIDLSLTANLLLIVIFSGYENFVSKIHLDPAAHRPVWMGSVDFAGMKIKLMGSIVAISGIALLRSFLPLGDEGTVLDTRRIGWMTAIHIAFVISGLALALTDWLSSKTDGHRTD